MEIIPEGAAALKTALEILCDESIPAHERFDRTEFVMAQLPQPEFPTFHHFGGGMYVRELCHPRGSFLTSVHFVEETLLFLLKGEVAVYYLQGDAVMRALFTAPTYTITLPETRRFVLALQDTTAVTVYRTDETDPDAAMEPFLSKRENPLLEGMVPGWKLENARHRKALGSV